MAYWFLVSAAAISLLGMVFHGVVGGKIYMGNIYKSDLEPLGKSLSLVSWHMFTIMLFVGAVVLFYVASHPDYKLAAYPVIAMNALGAVLFIFLGLGQHRQLITMPGAYLMAATSILAWLGLS
jgi:glucan phosphoethanolaminetransferase (alkaline phosphatase superfamily)